MKTITTTEMKTITTRGSGELVVDVGDNILKVGNYDKYGNFIFIYLKKLIFQFEKLTQSHL